MATSTTVLCGVCEARHVAKCADHWCPECEEGLCSNCQEHHSLSKGTRNHQIITIENYKTLPAFVAAYTDSCKEHDMKFTNYCSKHDNICCPVCLTTDHQNCTELRTLSGLIYNSKNSALIPMLEDKIQRLLSFLNQGIKERTENLDTVIQAQQTFSDEIRNFKSRINAKLDQLERTLMHSLTETTTTAKSNIEKSSTELSESLKHVTQLENSLHAVQEHGSDLQAFFGIRKIDKEIEQEVEKFRIISDEGRLSRIDIKLKLNNEVLNTVSKLTALGSVLEDQQKTSLQFPARENKEAQIITRMSPNLNDDVKATLLCTIELPKDGSNRFISGCAVCSNGNMMFTDYYNGLLIIYNQENAFQSQRPVSGRPTDVTIIDDTTAAVSTLYGGINIINVISKTIQQTINTKGACFGITYYEGSLLWCKESIGVQSTLLPRGKVSTLIQLKNLPAWSYLSSSEDKIFVTNPKTKCAVQCFTMQGEKMWEYENQSMTAITVDNDSNVYIVSKYFRGVDVVSSDGKRVRRLLCKPEHGLINPAILCFDRQLNNLLISDREGQAFLYHID